MTSESGGTEEGKHASLKHFVRVLGQSAVCQRVKMSKKVLERKTKTYFTSCSEDRSPLLSSLISLV